jgi:hypothetical protein
MNFEEALKSMREGKRVKRYGWRNLLDLTRKWYPIFVEDILATDWEIVE